MVEVPLQGLFREVSHRLDLHRSEVCMTEMKMEIIPDVTNSERRCQEELRVCEKDCKGTNLDVSEIVWEICSPSSYRPSLNLLLYFPSVCMVMT